mgnify:CR=1 FL=1
MRSTSLAVVLGLSCAAAATGCSSVRARGEDGVATVARTPASAAAAPRAGGPVEVTALARELGLRIEASGPGYLLSNADVRARVFPGSDRLTVDGRSVFMGEPARREGSSLVVPAGGADALRAAVAGEARQQALLAKAPPPVLVPVVAVAKAPAPVVLAPPPTPASRPTAGGDASWVPTVSERSWKYVVIHHSDDREGCCAKYDAVHRDKGWENGCGYHFVIGNGTQSGDGEIEPGPRWSRQIQGAHAKTADNRYNEMGVGIVLVGDFERGGRPTARQYESLVRLTRWLMTRYAIPSGEVLRHQDCKATACPGRNFPWSRYKADVSR